MKDWKLSEARARYSEIVARSSDDRLQELERESARPSIAYLLEEIASLNKEETDLEIPERNERALPTFN